VLGDGHDPLDREICGEKFGEFTTTGDDERWEVDRGVVGGELSSVGGELSWVGGDFSVVGTYVRVGAT
jgi:hypothetical protein